MKENPNSSQLITIDMELLAYLSRSLNSMQQVICIPQSPTTSGQRTDGHHQTRNCYTFGTQGQLESLNTGFIQQVEMAS